MGWFILAVKNTLDIDGRARRKEYWFFYLFYNTFLVPIVIVDGVLGLRFIVWGLYTLLMLMTQVSLNIRRLHDIGRSGLWFFISFVPLFGLLVLIFFMVQPSEEGENDWGPVPAESPA